MVSKKFKKSFFFSKCPSWHGISLRKCLMSLSIPVFKEADVLHGNAYLI